MNPNPIEILLDAVEVRVVAALVEKEITTPDYYPLSLNALVNACNQSSNRDPVTSHGEPAVKRALESLRDKKLAFVFEGAANRVAKYGVKLAETLALSRPEVAVLCVLMLRGPQTVGEIRGRAGRLHGFAALDEVESTLEALTARSPRPLVVRLPRQAGFKEPRYAHLLAGPPEAGSPVAATDAAGGVEGTPADRLARLEAAVADLRRELMELRARFGDLNRPPG